MSNVVETIGTYFVKEPTKYDVPQEYAGACQKVLVQPGEYPVEIRKDRWGKRYLCIPLPGVLVLDQFYNRIGAHGSMRTSRPMTETVHYLQPYCFNVATMAVDGKVELAEGWGTIPVVLSEGTKWEHVAHYLTKDGERTHV